MARLYFRCSYICNLGFIKSISIVKMMGTRSNLIGHIRKQVREASNLAQNILLVSIVGFSLFALLYVAQKGVFLCNHIDCSKTSTIIVFPFNTFNGFMPYRNIMF